MRKKLFDELLESVKQATAIERGKLKPSRVFVVNKKNEVARVRARLGLSQSRFASLLGISANTLKNWEQGRQSAHGCGQGIAPGSVRHPHAVLNVAA